MLIFRAWATCDNTCCISSKSRATVLMSLRCGVLAFSTSQDVRRARNDKHTFPNDQWKGKYPSLIFPYGGRLWKFLIYLELLNLWTKFNSVTNSIPPQSLFTCFQDLAIQNLQFCFIWALTTTGRWWRFNPIKRKFKKIIFFPFLFLIRKRNPV